SSLKILSNFLINTSVTKSFDLSLEQILNFLSSAGFSFKYINAFVKALSSFTLIKIPYLAIKNSPILISTSKLSFNNSNGPLIQLVDITGSPAAMASKRAFGKPSVLDDRTKQSFLNKYSFTLLIFPVKSIISFNLWVST